MAPVPGLSGFVLNGPEFPTHQSRIFTVFGPRESCACCSDAPCMNSRRSGNGVGSTLWYISVFMATRFRMNKKEFSRIRSHLGKTQKQMAQLLGISNKAIQSFEQGWRAIPVHIERQSLLLLALKESRVNGNPHCWTVKKCPGRGGRVVPHGNSTRGECVGSSTGRSAKEGCRKAGLIK